ncbi:hypothetical protein D8674_023027 [Pyrus ussuriensis x Pyrus communis]|uniref:Uncharacterized protein n=1 Tax=Pyrus ussuriensis x Pyrus communis TaxID=2448454 RepID=A0A5N5GLP4_9ROSA|nr:hypothetical protein D8674_023027 [Pyrus ussuriensis x Pyrus communis]
MGRGGVELEAVGGELGRVGVRLGGIRVGLNGGRLEVGGLGFGREGEEGGERERGAESNCRMMRENRGKPNERGKGFRGVDSVAALL